MPEPSEYSETIRDVEIFATGEWNGDKYTDSDLQAIVEAYDKVGFVPPVKLGHSREPGQMAYGWVKNLRKIGSKLLADFVDVPTETAKAIREKRFGSVSAEIFWNLKRNGEKFKRALAAVAILGGEVPGVSGLKPLYEFSNEDFEKLSYIEEKDMSDDIKTLQAQLEALQKTVDSRADEVKKFEVALTEKDAKLAELQQDAESAKKALAEMTEANRQREFTELANSCKIPAFRDHVKKFAEKVGVDDVKAFVDELNKKAETLFGEKTVKTQTPAEYEDPSRELNDRALKYSQEHKVDFLTALREVAKNDSNLAQDYVGGPQ